MNAEDKEMLWHHFRAWFGRYVPDEEQNGFDIFSMKKIQEDPDYWNQEGWRKLYDLYLAQKYPKKESAMKTVDKLIERVLNGEDPKRVTEKTLHEMKWIITKDNMFDGKYVTKNMTGKGTYKGNAEDLPYKWRVKDDDGEIYFEGKSDEKDFDPKDWAEGSYGATSIEFYNNGKWEVL